MSLSHDDVERIISLLDKSQFDEITLEMNGVKLELRRNSVGCAPTAVTRAWPSQAAAAHGDALAALTPIPNVRIDAAANTQVRDVPMPAAMPDQNTAGLIDITAPMLGTFYRAPKPGAEPFVQIGSQITPDDPVGIIEVMKLMNSIPSGVSGEVVQVLARDGDMVEYGQSLFRVRPV
jgi:acetyl-CoA carboxylase biotin carboxyl carrier protein